MTFPVPLGCAGDFAGLADLDRDLLPSACDEPNHSIILAADRRKQFKNVFYRKKWNDADSCHAELDQPNHFPVI